MSNVLKCFENIYMNFKPHQQYVSIHWLQIHINYKKSLKEIYRIEVLLTLLQFIYKVYDYMLDSLMSLLKKLCRKHQERK